MSKNSKIEFEFKDQLDFNQRVHVFLAYITRALRGGPLFGSFWQGSRSVAQNRKFHPLIGDIAKQIEIDGRKYHQKIWKAQLVDEFDQEMRRQGTPLRHETEVVWSLDRQRLITVRPSTTEFTKKECAMFIEFLYAYGCELGVKFNDQALKVYETYREAQAA